jgi:hypothetical protein
VSGILIGCLSWGSVPPQPTLEVEKALAMRVAEAFLFAIADVLIQELIPHQGPNAREGIPETGRITGRRTRPSESIRSVWLPHEP